MEAIFDAVADGFGTEPALTFTAPLTTKDGAQTLSAALWQLGDKGSRMVHTPAFNETAIISLHIDLSFEMDFQIDCQDVFRGRTGPGDFCFVPPGQTPQADLRGACSAFHIYVPEHFFAEPGPETMKTGPLFGHNLRFHRVVRSLLEFQAGAAHPDLVELSVMGRLAELTQALSQDLKPCLGPERLTRVQVRKTDALLAERFAENLTVADIAHSLDLSEAHFARAYRNTTGRTPMSALRAIRMEAARHALANSAMPIGQIAAEVGYADPSFFARAFKDVHGSAPAAWRRRRQGRERLDETLALT